MGSTDALKRCDALNVNSADDVLAGAAQIVLLPSKTLF